MSQDGGLTRIDIDSRGAHAHPRGWVRELIALLDQEFGWTTNESAVTGKLYTRRVMFVQHPA